MDTLGVVVFVLGCICLIFGRRQIGRELVRRGFPTRHQPFLERASAAGGALLLLLLFASALH
jgi:hypothetical protein